MGERSKLTTLCYIEKGDSYLMLHRVSKKHDVNKDKWIGIGGHFEENESPDEYSCAMKSHFRKFGNQMSGSGNHLCNYASLLA